MDSSDSGPGELDNEQERMASAFHEAGRRLAADDRFHDHFWSHSFRRWANELKVWIGGKILALIVGGAFGSLIVYAVARGWIK